MSSAPQENRPTRRRPSGQTRPASPIWLAGGVLLLMVLASTFSAIMREGETIQYSQFKQLLAENRVDELTITTDSIRGNYQKPDKTLSTFSTIRVDDPKLIEQLEAKHVRYEAAVDNKWIAEVLQYLIPIIVLLGIWLFFFRRMGTE